MLVRTGDGDVSVRSIENPKYNLTGDQLVSYLGLDAKTFSGRHITPEVAIGNVISVYRCVTLIAGTIASLPAHLYRRSEDDRRERVLGRGPVYPASLARLVGEMPNPEMTAQTFWETKIGHEALWGTSYVHVERDGTGRPRALWPLMPSLCEWRKVDGQLFLFYRSPDNEGKAVAFLPDEIMATPWFSTDGKRGLSPIGVARNAVAVTQAAEEYAGTWYTNGAMPSAVLNIPRGPKETFKERSGVYQNAVQGLWGGASKAGRIAVVEEGLDLKTLQMPQKDMQFLETRKFETGEVCNLYGVPHYMLDPEKTSSWGSGVENQFLGFLTTSLRPVIERQENGANASLGLVPGERTLLDESLYVEFQVDALMRTDFKARMEGWALAIQNRLVNPVYVAGRENFPYDPERPTDYTNPNTGAGAGEAGEDRLSLDELTIALQKIYLAVGVVISSEEARELLNRYGANLGAMPQGLGPRSGAPSLTEGGE